MLGYISPHPSLQDYFLNSMDWEQTYSHEYLGHQVLENLYFDPFKNEIEWTNPLVFGAKASTLDTPTLREIQNMSPPEIDGWYNAMDAEIAALHAKHTMIEIPRCQVPPGKQIVKSTWVFWRKRRPSGEINKLKARFVVRGDLQVLDEPQTTFSPVVAWSII
jgi:hypothetical protein